MTENPRAGAGNRRTRSQAAPEWTVTESLILVNEIAAVESDCSVELSSYQQWDIISGNCAALDVDRNLAQCRRKWRSLLAEYDDVRKGRRSSNLDPELFDAIGRVVKGREERGEIDRESDAEIGNENEDLDATVEIETGSKRKRQRSKPKRYREEMPKERHEEQQENTHLEGEYLKDFLGKKSKLKSPAKRRAKHIETPPTSLAERDENHDIEEKLKPTEVGNIIEENSKPTSVGNIIEENPKPTSVGNITNNNSKEENEEMLTLKLQELAIEIQDINAESADCKEANSENIEDYHTEFTRRQGDKLIARLGNFSNTLKQLCDLLQECK